MSPTPDHPRSRCTVPNDPPLTWVDYTDPDHPSIVAFENWLASLPFVTRQSVEAAIDAQNKRAARGAIREDDDRTLEPVISFPRVYELKVKLTIAGKKVEIRQYHLEPSELPNHLIKLHRHLKDTSGDRDQQRDEQNPEMSQAQLRALGGEPTKWGVDT